MTMSRGGERAMKENEGRGSEWEPRIVGFLCRWCSYAGADLAGSSRLTHPPSVRVIRVPCTSRISPHVVVKALATGVDGVLISGCHPGSCHYVNGNYKARRRFLVLRRLLAFMGVDPRRLQMSWVSASEGVKWAAVVRKVTEEIRLLGPNRLFSGEEA
jgi:F420-non-reducing hydrogenase iron-sulfur subunit